VIGISLAPESVICGRSFARQADQTVAAADAWPMFRGDAAGTGRSASRLHLPLQEAWSRPFPKTAYDATPVIGFDGIFIGDLDGTFRCLALDDGTTRWELKTDAGFPSAAAVSFTPPRPIVVVGDDLGMIRALDASTGEPLWNHETGGEISGGPTLLPPAGELPARVLIGSQDATLVCLGLNDGRKLWGHTIDDQIRCSPTVVETAAGRRVFLAGCDGRLHIIDADTGAAVATVPIGGPTGTTPAAFGDRVFFGTEGGSFLAVDFLKADIAWQHQPAANPQAYRSSAAIAVAARRQDATEPSTEGPRPREDGTAHEPGKNARQDGDAVVIVGSRGRAVEAYSASDGGQRWRRPMRGRVDASPVVVELLPAEDGPAVAAAILADAAGKVVALAASTGEPLWEFDAGRGFGGSPAVAQGRIVLAGEDGTVWCFSGSRTSPPEETPR
jgi:outer membrane protein assembly factor BamB